MFVFIALRLERRRMEHLGVPYRRQHEPMELGQAPRRALFVLSSQVGKAVIREVSD